MNVVQDLLDLGAEHSRPGTPLVPKGIVLHSTATPGAMARNIRDFFNTPKQIGQASAHVIVDHLEVIVAVPLNETAWHAGPSANKQFIGMELCEIDGFFHDAFLQWIDVAEMLCTIFGWPVEDKVTVWSHKEISETFHETNHTDPIGFLEAHGHDWNDVIARIKGG